MGLPRLDELVIARPRLLALLDELPALTLVRGPMGSGKTTLAAQWVAATRRSGQTVLWLDGFVDSPRHVVAAIARAVDVDVLEGVGPEDALKALTPVLRTMTDRLVVGSTPSTGSPTCWGLRSRRSWPGVGSCTWCSACATPTTSCRHSAPATTW